MYKHWTLNWCLPIKDINFLNFNCFCSIFFEQFFFNMNKALVSMIPLKIFPFFSLRIWLWHCQVRILDRRSAEWGLTKVMESFALFNRTLYIHWLLTSTDATAISLCFSNAYICLLSKKMWKCSSVHQIIVENKFFCFSGWFVIVMAFLLPLNHITIYYFKTKAKLPRARGLSNLHTTTNQFRQSNNKIIKWLLFSSLIHNNAGICISYDIK